MGSLAKRTNSDGESVSKAETRNSHYSKPCTKKATYHRNPEAYRARRMKSYHNCGQERLCSLSPVSSSSTTTPITGGF